MDLKTVNLLKAKGNQALSEKKYGEAFNFYAEALELVGLENKHVAAILYSNIAQAYLDQKDYPRAIENATDSLKLDPLFTKSNLRRAIGNVELDKLADAMNDLRLIFSSEPSNKKVKDLMRRCSDLPKMNRESHDLYVKHYVRQVLKKLGAQGINSQNVLNSILFQTALLRQLFLSVNSLDIVNYLFCKTFAFFGFGQRVFVSFLGWIARQLMWLKYPYISISVALSGKLFKLLHRLLRSETFSLTVHGDNFFTEKPSLLDKYFDVFLNKELMLSMKPVDKADLKLMNDYSNDMTRLLYHPALAYFKENKFPKAKALSFDEKHLITSDFLKLWEKNQWPIESLFFAFGVPNIQIFQLFNGVISTKVNKVLIKFAETNQAFTKVDYKELCKYLSTFKRVFPGLNDVTITQWHKFKAANFKTFAQKLALVRESCEIFSTKPDWCPKLKVVIFGEFMAFSRAESKLFDVELLEKSIESLHQKHPKMRICLCGPKSYDAWWSLTPCVHSVIEFENEVASFELAICATMH